MSTKLITNHRDSGMMADSQGTAHGPLSARSQPTGHGRPTCLLSSKQLVSQSRTMG